MKKIAGLFIVIGMIGLGGCASGKTVAESQEAAAAIPNGMGRVVVYRPNIFGTAIQPTVSIDGEKKGTCKPNGAFFAHVKPGDRVVSATTEVTRQTMVRVESGKSSFIRCSIGLGFFVGQPQFEVISPGTGKLESDKLVFTGNH